MTIRCLGCSNIIRNKDQVVITEINSLYHAECYKKGLAFEGDWKNFGSFENIIKKYHFLLHN